MMRRWALQAAVTVGMAASATLADEVISPAALADLDYQVYWTMNLQDARGATLDAAYLRDDALYVINSRGDAQAIDTRAGLSRWAQNIDGGAREIYPPTHFVDHRDRAIVVFTSSARIVLIDRYTGDLLGDFPQEQTPAGSAAASGDLLLFGSSDGHFYAQIWDSPLVARPVNYWRVRTRGAVNTTPVLVNAERDVIFAGQAGTVYNCTKLAKLLNWQFSTEGDQLADLAVDESGVYVASTDRSLYRLDPVSGQPRWRVRFPEPLHDAPVVAGRVVYQYCPGEGLVALDVDTGNLLWRAEEGRTVIGQNPDFVLLGAGGGQIQKIAASTGEILATVSLPADSRPVPQVLGDMIYLVTRRGLVLAAYPRGSPHLTPAQIAQARRDLHQQPRTDEQVEPEPTPSPGAPDDAVDLKDPLRSRSDRREPSN